jgi:AIPR protein
VGYNNIDDLVRKLSLKTDKEATKELTRFFTLPRFALTEDDFDRRYCDGANDGGIDIFNEEGPVSYIVQSKFSGTPRSIGSSAVLAEIRKVINTLTGQNPNHKADAFVNAVRHGSSDSGTLLEFIFLTTNDVTERVASAAQESLEGLNREHGWRTTVDFVPFGRAELQRLLLDIRYGYVPHTGKRELPIAQGPGGRQLIENRGDDTGVYSVVCTAKVTDLLKWILPSGDVGQFLQKNVRGYEGEKEINNGIIASFEKEPRWFWYKHNGIVIFADALVVSPDSSKLILRNPQVVNGGQTLVATYKAFDKVGRKDSDAEVLVRVYRFPYDRLETRKEGLEIVKALNSQNPTKPSDLHSNDSRQVRLEKLFEELGYKYHRKRAKENKSGRFSMTMRNLALNYLVCKKQIPYEGVAGQIEEIFSEDTRYQEVFPEDRIGRDLSLTHIALEYVLAWQIGELLAKVRKDLPKKERELYNYTRYFVLVDVYKRVLEWRQQTSVHPSWHDWKEFIESSAFEMALWVFARSAFKVASGMVPTGEEARKFFRRKESAERYFRVAPGSKSLRSDMNREWQRWEKRMRAEAA